MELLHEENLKRGKKLVKKQIEQEELQIAKDILNECKIITDGKTGKIFRYFEGVYKPLSQNEIEYYIISEYEDQELQYNRNKKGITLDFIKSKSYQQYRQPLY